jgi:hypothetical protein
MDISLIQGINCRYGNRGVIAENHYDAGRNFVAMLKGFISTFKIYSSG